MRKAILVGNGFSLNCIEDYKNESMMKRLRFYSSSLIDDVENHFEIFRNLSIKDIDLFSYTEALFPSKHLYPGNGLYPKHDCIVFTVEVKKWVVEKLTKLGFTDPNSIYETYFESYGLNYSINRTELSGVETYLKAVSMFENIGIYSNDDYTSLEKAANQVYYNDGKYGENDISNFKIDHCKINNFFSSFDDVYTTNYDLILDDFLKPLEKYPYHLHGGFSIKNRNRAPDGRYNPSEAFLVWGKDGDEKMKKLKAGTNFNHVDFGAFRFGQSKTADYYDKLEIDEYDEFYVLGYSGENDDHINSRIRNNENIKQVIWFVDPRYTKDGLIKVKSRLLFGRDGRKMTIKSWSEFWERVMLS